MAAPVFSTGDVPSAFQVNEWFVNKRVGLKTSDESVTSSITLQDDNELFVAVDASSVYMLHIFILYTAASAADLKWQLQGPSGSNADFTIARLVTGAAATTDDATDGFGLSADVFCGGLGTSQTCFGSGLFKTAGTAGTLKIQWAQATSSGSATVVHADSYIVLERIA